MSMPDTSAPEPHRSGARWAVPAVAVAAGIGYLVAGLMATTCASGCSACW